MTKRVLIWWSTGAASYVAAKIALRQYPEALVVRCETGNEDPDDWPMTQPIIPVCDFLCAMIDPDQQGGER